MEQGRQNGSSTPQSSITVGDSLADGRCLLTEGLGEGGSGQVFAAIDLWERRSVALKVFHGDVADEDFICEVMALAAVRHCNVIGYLGHGVSGDGTRYLVMERAPGQSLARELEESVRSGTQPSGLLRAMLLDAGAVRESDDSRTHQKSHGQRTPVGTPPYMAPEHLVGNRIEPSSDIFQVGVVAYEFVTWRLPHPGRGQIEIALARAKGPPADVLSVCPETDPRVAALIMSMLQTSPQDRPSSADVKITCEKIDPSQTAPTREVDPYARTAPLLPPTLPRTSLLAVPGPPVHRGPHRRRLRPWRLRPWQ